MIFLFIKTLLIGFAIAMPVGPIGMLCIKNTLKQGFFIGLAVGIGAACADAIYGMIAGCGTAAIAAILLSHTTQIRIVGGLLLIFLGLKEIKSHNSTKARDHKKSSNNFLKTIAISFALTATNPATVLSFVAIFASIGGSALTLHNISIMVLGVFCGSLIWWITLSGCVSIFKSKIPKSVMNKMSIISGTLLAAFGVLCIVI